MTSLNWCRTNLLKMIWGHPYVQQPEHLCGHLTREDLERYVWTGKMSHIGRMSIPVLVENLFIYWLRHISRVTVRKVKTWANLKRSTQDSQLIAGWKSSTIEERSKKCVSFLPSRQTKNKQKQEFPYDSLSSFRPSLVSPCPHHQLLGCSAAMRMAGEIRLHSSTSHISGWC